MRCTSHIDINQLSSNLGAILWTCRRLEVLFEYRNILLAAAAFVYSASARKTSRQHTYVTMQAYIDYYRHSRKCWFIRLEQYSLALFIVIIQNTASINDEIGVIDNMTLLRLYAYIEELIWWRRRPASGTNIDTPYFDIWAPCQRLLGATSSPKRRTHVWP